MDLQLTMLTKEKQKEYYDRYYKKHKEAVDAYRKQYRKDNPLIYKASFKRWQQANPEKCTANTMKWYRANRAKLNAKEKDRMNTDINFYMKKKLSHRIRMALKSQGKNKDGLTVELIGCQVEELRNYLEKKFTDGMSWANRKMWHIDHIIPLSSFDLTKKEEQLRAFHYTNLQPLWAEDNIRKSNK